MIGLMEYAMVENADLVPIEAKLAQKVLQYAGHIYRRDSKSIGLELDVSTLTNFFTAKLVLPPGYQAPEGVTKKVHGVTYTDVLRRALEDFGINRTTWTNLAAIKSKGAWSRYIKGAGLTFFMRKWLNKKRLPLFKYMWCIIVQYMHM